MLDAITKRNIDSARQILVGKVPDPKAQVEQITTALVYKFMDDMSKEAEELGGKAKFFTDDLKGFAWSELLDTRHSGQERINLYSRAISAFTKAKQLPTLFRNIFKDAFLPYRDPETLSLFLKEIDNFAYDHSENLGNAFEYLLSILGSQGDAGQFRTPRHIIDFIVEVVDPKKNETILDPACGTAGFLISAYKHILKHNSSDFQSEKEKAKTAPAEKTYLGDRLTPNEKKKLMRNFAGYDISPDMAKLSLVNMYLHGFPDPEIHEYDTLTSENRWGEEFDVILANPPFMSPKGGIRPHKRFSVQAKRSEVLFVDYIVEHLSLKGRAGIIVPEGIIFKAENAYKQLRQMLVEDGLFAVVSLPSGVFNPYSGVKTSILLFDNQLGKKTDEILFLKIGNDGFDLGAQRRKIDKDDLPEALEVLEAWKQSKKKKSSLALWVNKEKIAESGDYNLTGGQYQETKAHKNQKWPMVELGEVVVDMKDGGTPSRKNPEYFGGNINWAVVKDIKPEIWHTSEKLTELGLKNSSAKIWEADSIIISLGASIGNVGIAKKPTATKQGLCGIVVNRSKVIPEFLAHVLRSEKLFIQSLASGVTIKEVRPSKLKSTFIFPLPPLSVQKEIVEQIEVKQNAINHAKEIIKNLERERRYFGEEIRKLEDVEMVELGEVAEIGAGNSAPQNKELFKEGKYPFCRTADVGKVHVSDNFKEIKDFLNDEGAKGLKLHKKDTILFPKSGASIFLNHRAMLAVDSYVSSHLATIYSNKDKILPKFLFNILCLVDARDLTNNQSYPSLRLSRISEMKIPLPPLQIQKQLIAEVEKEEEIIAANRRLIEILEQKIAGVLKTI